jgi:hypothetical protein
VNDKKAPALAAPGRREISQQADPHIGSKPFDLQAKFLIRRFGLEPRRATLIAFERRLA